MTLMTGFYGPGSHIFKQTPKIKSSQNRLPQPCVFSSPCWLPFLPLFLQVFSFRRGAPLRFQPRFPCRLDQALWPADWCRSAPAVWRQPPFLVTQRGKHGREQDRRVLAYCSLGVCEEEGRFRCPPSPTMTNRILWTPATCWPFSCVCLALAEGRRFWAPSWCWACGGPCWCADSMQRDLGRGFGLHLEPTLRLLHHRLFCFLGCFLPTSCRRPFWLPPSLWAGDFWRLLSCPFWFGRRSRLAEGAASFEPEPL